MPLPPVYTSNGANGTQVSPVDDSFIPVEGNAQALAYAVAEAETDGQTITLTQLAPGLTPIELPLAIPADRPITGMEATQDGTNKLQTNVAGGTFQILGVKATYVGSSVTSNNGDGTYPRYDIVTIDADGTLAVQAGTPAAMPVLPTLTAGLLALAVLFVPPNAISTSTNIQFGAVGYSNQSAAAAAAASSSIVVQYETTGPVTVNAATTLLVVDVNGGNVTATLPDSMNHPLLIRYRGEVTPNTLTLQTPAGVSNGFDKRPLTTTYAINSGTLTYEMYWICFDPVNNTYWTGDPNP